MQYLDLNKHEVLEWAQQRIEKTVHLFFDNESDTLKKEDTFKDYHGKSDGDFIDHRTYINYLFDKRIDLNLAHACFTDSDLELMYQDLKTSFLERKPDENEEDNVPLRKQNTLKNFVEDISLITSIKKADEVFNSLDRNLVDKHNVINAIVEFRNKFCHNQIPVSSFLAKEIDKLLNTGKLPDYEYKRDENDKDKRIKVRKAEDIDVPLINSKPDRTDKDFCKNYMIAMFEVIKGVYDKISAAIQTA